KHCTACHSARTVNEPEVSGGLALDTLDAILKAKQKPVHAGKSKDSPLIQRITSPDPDKRMPPAAPAVPEERVARLRRWIDGGLPEGTKPTGEAGSVVTTPGKSRKLPVVLATNATPPSGLFKGNPAKLALSMPVGPLAPVTAVAFSPDGKLLATGSY